jgi:DNA-binding NtrC family response regulator
MPRHLLIVDDDEALRGMLEAHFVDIGITCTTAGDGEEALAILRRCQIQVMLTDLDMPGMDGMSLLRAVRENGLYTRGIVLTGYATLGNLTGCLREGALALMPKPLPGFAELDRAVDLAFQQVEGWITQLTRIVDLRGSGTGSGLRLRVS